MGFAGTTIFPIYSQIFFWSLNRYHSIICSSTPIFATTVNLLQFSIDIFLIFSHNFPLFRVLTIFCHSGNFCILWIPKMRITWNHSRSLSFDCLFRLSPRTHDLRLIRKISTSAAFNCNLQLGIFFIWFYLGNIFMIVNNSNHHLFH